MEPIIDLLFKVWKLEKPNLIISVTGGAQKFTLKARLRDVFRKGLVKAATSTSKIDKCSFKGSHSYFN